MVRVGICGCGFMGRTHHRLLSARPDVRITALMDIDEGRRHGRWSDRIGNLPSRWDEALDMSAIRSHATVEDLVADPDVDLVVVTLPTHLHAATTIAALRAGKHVLCEKPMALSSADCDRIVAAARAAPGYYMVAQCIRFWPQYAEIKRRVDSGEYGPVRSVMLRRIASPPGYSAGGWLMDHQRSGGALLDLHVHDVDYALYLLGPPRGVLAGGTRGPSGGIDHVSALWDYGPDQIVSLEGGWSYHPGFAFEMFVNVRCDLATMQWRMSDGPRVKLWAAGRDPQEIDVKPGDGWSEEIDYFLNCVARGQRPTIVTPESSALAIRIAELERESIQRGEKVLCGEWLGHAQSSG